MLGISFHTKIFVIVSSDLSCLMYHCHGLIPYVALVFFFSFLYYRKKKKFPKFHPHMDTIPVSAASKCVFFS